ncbi:MAG: hypothetical protein FJ279_14225 [Planctomycetes bacterium]|nr:hypothetical protein [Planctomycetota bacterium]
MSRGKQVRRLVCVAVVGMVLAMCLAEARKAQATEIVVTAKGRTRIWLTNVVREFFIRSFELGDIPAAGCRDATLDVPFTHEVVITTEGQGGIGECQNPPPGGVAYYNVDVGPTFILNGQDIGHSARLQGAGNLEFTIRLEAWFNSDTLRTWDRNFTIKSVNIDFISDPYHVCKGGTATFEVRTTPEDGAQYVTGASGSTTLDQSGPNFTLGPCDTAGEFTVSFDLFDSCQHHERRLRVVEMKDIRGGPVCANQKVQLAATTIPAGRSIWWSIVGQAPPGCSLTEGGLFTAGPDAASVTVKAQDVALGCSATGTVEITSPSFNITTVPPYALVGFTKDFSGNPIKLKAAFDCGGGSSGGTYTWSVLEDQCPGRGQFGKVANNTFDPSYNGTPEAQEVIFRASAEGLTKVKVVYSVAGQTYTASPVEFMSNMPVTIRLELQDPEVNGVRSGLDEATLAVMLNDVQVGAGDLALERTWADMDGQQVLAKLKLTYKPSREKLRSGQNTVTVNIKDKVKNAMNPISSAFNMPSGMW